VRTGGGRIVTLKPPGSAALYSAICGGLLLLPFGTLRIWEYDAPSVRFPGMVFSPVSDDNHFGDALDAGTHFLAALRDCESWGELVDIAEGNWKNCWLAAMIFVAGAMIGRCASWWENRR
jgi:hypothetical protein